MIGKQKIRIKLPIKFFYICNCVALDTGMCALRILLEKPKEKRTLAIRKRANALSPIIVCNRLPLHPTKATTESSLGSSLACSPSGSLP